MKNLIQTLLVATTLVMVAVSSMAQEKCTFEVKASADLVSNYVWRGVPCYSINNSQAVLAPNLQPALAFAMGGLEIGAWGSSDFTGSYKEMDLYASYSIKGFTATVTDYYWDLDWLSKPYFSYKNETTSHVIEGALSYEFEKIPLSISVASMLYGADKKISETEEDSEIKNNYSTYIELGYNFKFKETNFDAFLGMTPADGLYGDGYGSVTGFGVVNMGLKGSKTIKIAENYETTLSTSLIFNPQHDKAFLVVGISF